MNVDAADMDASEASDALMEASSSGLESTSTMFFPMDRKMTSRDNWVMPRCDREPRMVCDCEGRRSVSYAMVYIKYRAHANAKASGLNIRSIPCQIR